MSSGVLHSSIVEQFRIAYQQNCIGLLIDGYRRLIASGTMNISWEEEKITMELARFMKLSNIDRNLRIHIVAEPRLYDDISTSGPSPKEAPKIDLQLLNWSSSTELVYNIEAKNLAETDWTKASGANVSSSFLTARYIDTGVENFINNRYANGCLTGYALNGEASKIVNNINGLLGKRKRNFEKLDLATPIEGYTFCYKSLHQKSTTGNNFVLPHIILRFS